MSARVSRSPGALYAPSRIAAKRRRCDGHLRDSHWINAGDRFVWSALPPNDPEVGNDRWWHAAFCMDCAPLRPDGGEPA